MYVNYFVEDFYESVTPYEEIMSLYTM